MMIVCPWCRTALTAAAHRYPEIPQHEEPGYSGRCPASFSYPEAFRDLADIRYRNGWDRKLPAHP